MGNIVLKVKESSVLKAAPELPPLKTGGKDPAKDNFCMEVCVSGEGTEQMVEDFGDFFDEGGAESEALLSSIENEYLDRRMPYYVGVVRAKFVSEEGAENEVGENKDKIPNLLIRTTSRFKELDVVTMLSTVRDDEEIRMYLETGKKNVKEALFSVDEDEEISLTDNYVLKDCNALKDDKDWRSEVEQIKKEYAEIYKLQKLLENQNHNIEEYKGSSIRPYSINMALLFELYARAYVRKYKDKYRMLKYVADKQGTKELKQSEYGVKCILEEKGGDALYLDGTIIPDIVLVNEDEKDYIILDVKYKDPEKGSNRDDRLQILAYTYMYNAKEIGHIFPGKNRIEEKEKYRFKVNSEQKDIYYNMFFIK